MQGNSFLQKLIPADLKVCAPFFQQDINQFETSPFGIHWPNIDEDLSLEGFLTYTQKELI